MKGDYYKCAFKVKIGKEETIDALKKAIKDEKCPDYNHMPIDSLVLWKVSIPYDPDLFEKTRKLNLFDDDVDEPSQASVIHPIQSSPTHRLSEIFSEPLIDGHVHILVKPPGPRSSENNSEDMATTLMNRYVENVEIFRERSPARDSDDEEINLPEMIAPPVELFHPVFARFLDDLSSDIPPSLKMVRLTAALMRAATPIYESASSRRAAIKPHLEEILSTTLTKVVNGEILSADGMALVPLTGEIRDKIAVMFWENKNEFGSAGRDAVTKARLSAYRFWVKPEHAVVRANSCCPTFLLATAGPHLTIFGAVFIKDQWIAQPLTDFIWIGIQTILDGPQYAQIARVMYALRKNVARLGLYYAGLKVTATEPEDSHPRFFPSPSAYRDEEDRIIEFKYIKSLIEDLTSTTFLAETTTGTPKQVVVKFVQRYRGDAHRLLANHNLAPQLFYCGKIGVLEGDPSYKRLQMVVMEHIDGKTFDEVARIPPNWIEQVRRALDILHGHDYVFGNLRQSNIMVTNTDEIKLVDFGWAGIQGSSKYPLMMPNDIEWPTGMGAWSIMETLHDDEMLKRIIQEKQTT